MNKKNLFENDKEIYNNNISEQDNCHFTLWNGRNKFIPPPPMNHNNYTQDDSEYWYEMEYGFLNVEQIKPIPSPKTGPNGKTVICIKPESDAYQKECELAMVETANNFGINLSIIVSGWEKEKQVSAFQEAIVKKPDLIINIPGVLSESAYLYKSAYEKGIPVISTTLSPAIEAYSYLVSWCGHDAWLESRLLAKKFAELMHHKGGYCIIRHMPDTSAYYSRTFGFLTELSIIAPNMKLLEMETSYLDLNTTETIVNKWIKKFGKEIQGIVCSNDIAVLNGMNKALKSLDRVDIIKVSNGTTRDGLQSLKTGDVDAITFKSPIIDGSLPIQIAADWFDGLLVDPIRFLPTHIITKDDVDEYLDRTENLQEFNLKLLCDAIEQLDNSKLETFFSSIYLSLTLTKIVSIEAFRGFTIELFSQLVHIINKHDLSTEDIVGSYESIFKGLFYQTSIQATLEWIKNIAERIINEIFNQCNYSTIDNVIHFVKLNISKPITLKEISYKFDISPRYLGKLFLSQTGKCFNDYVNNSRISLAKTFLKNTSMNISRISYQVGFDNPNYFSKQFKLYTGMTPTAYRRSYNKKQK